RLICYYLLLTGILLGSFRIAAQEEPVVLSEWPEVFTLTEAGELDTVHIIKFLKQGESIRETNKDSALLLFGAALNGSVKTQYGVGTVSALTGLGSIHRDQGNYTLAKEYYARALALAKRMQVA